MQETAFNLGYTRIKKNREFRKENNNLSIVVSSKRMRERERRNRKKCFFLSREKGILVNSQYCCNISCKEEFKGRIYAREEFPRYIIKTRRQNVDKRGNGKRDSRRREYWATAFPPFPLGSLFYNPGAIRTPLLETLSDRFSTSAPTDRHRSFSFPTYFRSEQSARSLSGAFSTSEKESKVDHRAFERSIVIEQCCSLLLWFYRLLNPIEIAVDFRLKPG